MSERILEGRWCKQNDSWCISGDIDWTKGLLVDVVSKKGKRQQVEILKKVGENQYGGIYTFRQPIPVGHAKWVKRGENYCLYVPNGVKKGDEINVLKKDGEIQSQVLNVHIEGNYWYAESQKGVCDECDEKGPAGDLCPHCNEGFFTPSTWA